MILACAVSVFFFIVVLNALFWPRLRATGSAPKASVSVLIPARDELKNLGACLDAALATDDAVREVLVYDDHSSDGTADLVLARAAREPRLRLLSTEPLPAGWCGKNFACSRLAAESSGEWLLFLDADARLAPDAPARMVSEALHRDATLLSLWPGFELAGFWERALMPMLNFVVFTLYPAPLSFTRDDASLGLAHGACLVAQRAAYERIGGHGAVRGEIFEDTRLARVWRERGERSLCVDGQQAVRVRMYESFGEIWRGFQKNLFPAFRHEASFWAFLLLHFVVFLWPFVTLNWKAAVMVWGMRAILAASFRQPWWSVPLHPAGEIVLLALGVSSWWRCRSGRGVTWKGRQYRTSRV